MKNRRKQGKIFRSLLAVLMLTAMLVTSVLQPVFAGDYEAGKTGNLTLTVQQADEEGNQTPLPDVGLTIYKVGSVNFDGNVHFVLDEALAAAAIDFDSITTADGWYEAAEKLAAMIVSGIVDVWGMSKSSDADRWKQQCYGFTDADLRSFCRSGAGLDVRCTGLSEVCK